MTSRARPVAILFGVLACGCGSGAPTPTGPQMATTPPPVISLPDPVSYDVIQSHRLCFERASPVIGESGVFVIDASARRAWGFAQTADFTGGLFNSPAISPDGLRIAYTSLGDFLPAHMFRPRSPYSASPTTRGSLCWTSPRCTSRGRC